MVCPKAVWFVNLLFPTLVNCIPKRSTDHYVDGKHNVEHDHAAFLGDDTDIFDKLSPEDSKMRLSEIVDKIDKTNDGKITKNELRDWIEYIQLKHYHDQVNKNWGIYDKNGDGNISWEEFKNTSYSYGSTEDDDTRFADKRYRKRRELDRKKWQAADSNNDNMLTKGEYSAFLHPNDYRRMHNVAADEILWGVDKDEDGFVSVDEYLDNTHSEGEGPKSEASKWAEEEKRTFKTHLDKDGDGKLNQEEVVQWIFPDGYDRLDAEARHLIYEADANKDHILTKQEILNKQDIFVGSQATNFGETLNRPTDEL